MPDTTFKFPVSHGAPGSACNGPQIPDTVVRLPATPVHPILASLSHLLSESPSLVLEVSETFRDLSIHVNSLRPKDPPSGVQKKAGVSGAAKHKPNSGDKCHYPCWYLENLLGERARGVTASPCTSESR